MKKKVISMLLVSAMALATLVGCGGSETAAPAASDDSTPAATEETAAPAEDTATESSGEVTEFTYFITMPGSEINDDNEIAAMIAEKYGVKVKETWLTGQTASEATGTLIAGGEYPDFIDSDEMAMLLDAGALLPLDEYIDKYPEFKEAWFTEEEWEKFRQPDGHIYWINPFGNTKGENKQTTHNDEAFWIQVRVLEWAGYPQIKTMDQYFDLLESYIAENPTMEDGTPNIAYTILCEDWRYFCLENAGQFLAGYPNDGSVIVDKATMTVNDYNVSEDTIKYFKKLNEEYQKGMVDPESFTQTYDEYIAKLSTGRVLGMIDQWWDFAFTINDIFATQDGGKLEEAGCNYVPLGLTIEKGMDNQWNSSGDTVNVSSGIGISVDCQDPDAAFQFIDDLLSQEIHDLRFWGVEGVDYGVDENGLYYRTDEQRTRCAETDYKASHMCTYSNFPQYSGTSRDGKNAMQPAQQPSEFMDGLPEPVQKCFKAYGVQTYVEFIDSVDNYGPWFPMWSYSNTLSTDTAGGVAWTKMGEIKHEWLPLVVMADDFDAKWDEYMEVYKTAKPEDFLAEMQEELDRRIANAQ